nr:hypothetical protein CPGR_02842 [Mycolicibacter nonchromogenicus]
MPVRLGVPLYAHCDHPHMRWSALFITRMISSAPLADPNSEINPGTP